MNPDVIDGLELIVLEPERRLHEHALLFVHGAFAGAWVWAERFLPYFAGRGFRVAAVSLRGHGLSRGRDEIDAASIADYVEDMDAAIADLGEMPVLIGHSMGGFVVQKFLEREEAATLVPAAVLMCAVPPQGLMGSTFHLAATRPHLMMDLNRLMGGGDIDARSVRDILFAHDVSLADIRRYTSLMSRESPRAIWDMSMFDLVCARNAGATPLMVIGTEQDQLIPPFLVRSTASAYGVPANIFSGLGHALMLEPEGERVARAIVDWLSGVDV